MGIKDALKKVYQVVDKTYETVWEGIDNTVTDEAIEKISEQRGQSYHQVRHEYDTPEKDGYRTRADVALQKREILQEARDEYHEKRIRRERSSE